MSTLGPRTALKSRKISGSLAYILAQTNVKQGTKAATNDVAGCTLEMGADGKWVGTLGSLSKAAADALVASGALASVKVGTPGNVNGHQVTWGGAGWVAAALQEVAFSSPVPKSTLSNIKRLATFTVESIKKYQPFVPNLTYLDTAWEHVLPVPAGITLQNGTITLTAISASENRVVGFQGIPYVEPLNRQLTATIAFGGADDVASLTLLHDIPNDYTVRIKISPTGADYRFRGVRTTDFGTVGAYAFGLNPTVRVTVNNMLIIIEVLIGGAWTKVLEKALNSGPFGNPSPNLRAFDWSAYIPSVGSVNNVSGNIVISNIKFGPSIPVGYRDMQFVKNADGSVYSDNGHVYMSATTGIISSVQNFPASNCVILRMTQQFTEIEEVSEIYTSYAGTPNEHNGDCPIFFMRTESEWVWYASSFGYSGSQGRNLGPGIYWGRTSKNILSGTHDLPPGSWVIPAGDSSTANYDAHVIYANGAWHMVWTSSYGASISYCAAPSLDGLVSAAASPSTIVTAGEGPKLKIDESEHLWAVEANSTGDVKVFDIDNGIITLSGTVATLSGFKSPHLDVVVVPSDAPEQTIRALTFDCTELAVFGAYSHGRIHLVGN